MEHNTKQPVNQWPSYAWIMFLQITAWIWNGVVLILLTATIWSFDITNITDNPLLGLTLLSVIIWVYWQYRLKGKEPSTKNGLSFLTYFDSSARKMVWKALGVFRRSNDAEFALKHFMLIILRCTGMKLTLLRLGINLSDIKKGMSRPSNSMKEIFATAFKYAVEEKIQVSWHHLIKAVLQSSNFSWLLESKKISLDEALAVVDWAKKDLGYRPPKLQSGLLHDVFAPRRNFNKTWTARSTPTLDRFSRNLTNLAKVGFLTSAKVRSKEVEEAIRVLSRSQENGLILVGEPGVGKTSIVGDVALRMIKGDIPALEDYKLISLDVGGILGSALGFQKAFSRIVNEAAQSGNTILFIGNLDQLGKAKAQEGFDLSAILLSALQHKQLQLIGTSDPLNYKKYIENNSNLVQLFSRVSVNELDSDKAILVLEDLSRKIESRQKVLITLEAIKAAVSLAQKYIHIGKLPDKAIDLLDEAAVYTSRSKKRKVTKTEVEAVMSSKTNIPVGNIGMEEKDKLIGLEDKIHSRLIGQEDAVKAVSESFKRARLEVSSSRKRPIGTFMFLGPTGVGKTELAKSLAWAYFGDESRIIRLDMSEFQTKESIYKLLGAPAMAGDVALSGGSFTEKVKKTPFAVVLLDEIEKAHQGVIDAFLQVLDEGRLTDSLGNTVDFTHTIIIATSNAQARFIQEAVRSKADYSEMQKQMIQKLLQENFRPEFINRFDGMIIFKPLTELEIEKIAELKINKLKKHLKENKDIELEITNSAIKKLAKLGYDPAFGARPLERVIREKLETKIANILLSSKEPVKRISITEEDI